MKTNLRVIEGGKRPQREWKRFFESATITDTRLMGAMCMHITWRAIEDEESIGFHQFFYFETEEDGLEAYEELWTNNPDELALLELETSGGLGGTNTDLTLTEAKYILKSYVDFNQSRGIPLPEKSKNFLPLIEDLPEPTPKESRLMLEKQCGHITGPYQVINYFLMRCFGKDYEPMAVLASPVFVGSFNIFPEVGISVMCKNTINQDDDGYTCESLIETEGVYRIVKSRITLDNLTVESCRVTDSMIISSTEAAMILARPEYITVYTFLINEEGLKQQGLEPFALPADSMAKVYDNGTLYFSFFKNNSHVNKRVFLLSADVECVYYMSNNGELLAMSYDEESILNVERHLQKCKIYDYAFVTDRYMFKDPVLYDYINSDFESFFDFVSFISIE